MPEVALETPGAVDADAEAPVLAFEDCALALAGTHAEAIPLSVTLCSGEFLVLHLEDDQHEEAVIQALCGLWPPLAGRVRFQGHDWEDLRPEQANALRGRIGTVFREDVWSPYRTVMEDMVLAQMHHTRRPLDEILAEAAHWSLRFGLPGLPRDMPVAVRPQDRQGASFARAFLGAPALIVIRHQTRTLPPWLLAAVTRAIWELRERGAAVIWFGREDALTRGEALSAARHLRLEGAGLAGAEPPR